MEVLKNKSIKESKPAKSFRDLVVWQKAHELVLAVYKLTERFPKTEIYGLIAQIRRSAVSVPANIAEGFKKRGQADKARYLNIAQASMEETRYYLILAQDLGYAETENEMKQSDEVCRLLDAFYYSVTNANT